MKNAFKIADSILNVSGAVVGGELLETTYLWLGIILLVINIASLLGKGIFELVKWYKKSKADGEITNEELDEASKIVGDTAKGINDEINNFKDSQNKALEDKKN